MIPYSTQDISDGDIRAVAKVMRQPFLTQGPAVAGFEKALAARAGAKYCASFTSGTAALHAAYFAAGVSAGDEVIVPAITFAATANCALYLNAKPVFADVDLDTGLMNVAAAAKNITTRTKVIAPVDYGGRPSYMPAFRRMAKSKGLVLIEDGAHSLGASQNGKPVGSLADMTMFSFHPVKAITTGEGGAIVTDNENYYKKLVQFRSHGIAKDVTSFERKGLGPWYQEMQFLGFNYRMPDILAALGESQLRRLGTFVERRRAVARRYRKLFVGETALVLPPDERSGEVSAWHLYPVRLASGLASRRDEVLIKLRAAGIGVQVHYLPVYRHVYYEKLGYPKGLCPNAEAFAASEISLPVFPKLRATDQAKVARTLKTILAEL
ncbi:MAG TPA: UDP-4-amino-4,6-dideoxy-N-acetyl-beta-L-altrosamine transaminase [Rhizomicrobium sp.]|nr:UDP-4-amino-4,6-dideoxy-N-acetyl-beta-L-altrosamine transaminase [Rhizomicrobium sp.]